MFETNGPSGFEMIRTTGGFKLLHMTTVFLLSFFLFPFPNNICSEPDHILLGLENQIAKQTRRAIRISFPKMTTMKDVNLAKLVLDAAIKAWQWSPCLQDL